MLRSLEQVESRRKSELAENMEVMPFIIALTSAETACLKAVECLEVFSHPSGGPEFNNLVRLQQLYGMDGDGGYRNEICSLIGQVGHSLNTQPEPRRYCIGVLNEHWIDNDGELHWGGKPCIEGSLPFEIESENSVSALLKLIDLSKDDLMHAIGNVTGGNIEWITAGMYDKPLLENAWERLSNHWDVVLKECRRFAGLDFYEFRTVIHDEVNIAKRLLTESPQSRTTDGQTGLPQFDSAESVGSSNSESKSPGDRSKHTSTDQANSQSQKGSRRGPTANQLMLDILQKDPESRGWTLKQWMQKISKGKSTICETPTWKELSLVREGLKIQRRKDRRRR